MSVDPAVQARYEEVVAEYGATGAELSTELAARQQELDAQLAADRDKLAELGQSLTEAHDRDTPRTPDRRPEDNDVSARAEDYQELDEDLPPEPAPPPPPVRQPRADDEDEVAEFRWDDDPVPAPAPRRAARARREEEDLSDHDWLQ